MEGTLPGPLEIRSLYACCWEYFCFEQKVAKSEQRRIGSTNNLFIWRTMKLQIQKTTKSKEIRKYDLFPEVSTLVFFKTTYIKMLVMRKHFANDQTTRIKDINRA
jgi:hypothetical protein